MHLCGEGDHGAWRLAHVGGRSRRQLSQSPPGLGDGIFDHRADEAADRFVKEPRAVDAGIGLSHLGERAAGDRHLGELGKGEEPRAVAVIDVVIVIGDVVGE